jgi:peptide/nickel transport system substrate-binding protein
LIAVLAAAALVYRGLNPASGAPAAPMRGGTLSIAQATDATILDMHLYTDGATANMLDHMFERLFHFAPGGGVIPVLATGFTVSPDNRTWTIRLRSGVRFHDGTPFNAEAVKFNLDRVFGPGNQVTVALPHQPHY